MLMFFRIVRSARSGSSRPAGASTGSPPRTRPTSAGPNPAKRCYWATDDRRGRWRRRRWALALQTLHDLEGSKRQLPGRRVEVSRVALSAAVPRSVLGLDLAVEDAPLIRVDRVKAQSDREVPQRLEGEVEHFARTRGLRVRRRPRIDVEPELHLAVLVQHCDDTERDSYMIVTLYVAVVHESQNRSAICRCQLRNATGRSLREMRAPHGPGLAGK
jgi:hypothetical protein